MPLASVNPNQTTQGQIAQATDDSLMKQPPITPVPGANPMNTSELGANKISQSTLAGDTAIAKATQQGDQAIANAKSSGGGGLGGIFGAVGSILGGLFAEGGPVGYADGGSVDDAAAKERDLIGKMGKPDPNLQEALAKGYLVGALHQSKFGGTPETLSHAAQIIKQMLEGGNTTQGQAPGMAQGGPANPNPSDNLADQQLAQALGLSPQVQPAQAQGAPNMAQGGHFGLPQKAQEHMPYNPMAAAQPPQQAPMGQPMQGMPQQAQPQGFAMGGAEQPPGGPPTIQSPNQDAPAEGEVKGPGGPTDDLIPAKLSNGEFVMSAAATQYWGVDKLAQMNDKGKQGFMQRVQQVQDNQQQGPNGAPVQPPMGQGQPQMPMMQAKGGPTNLRTRGSGYCGL